MKIGIIGAGISGLTAAYYLHRKNHDVTLFEANDYVGGHTNTIKVDHQGEQFAIDTGFIVFNDRTYPNFRRLLAQLQVEAQPTEMSFSFRCDHAKLEYRGADLQGLFAQRSNLISPRFLGMLRDIVRFNKVATALTQSADDRLSVGDFFRQHRFGDAFRADYFLPMASAIWSCPVETIEAFPIRFIVQFYYNHGLLELTNRPQWYVIRGGSSSYVKPLIRGFEHHIQLSSPVRSVSRHDDRVEIVTDHGAAQFDHIIFACHSDQALRILGADATPIERSILEQFPYQRNVAVLHTDEALMPRRKRAWASWNFLRPGDGGTTPVTYYMNGLQGLSSRDTFCVTLNGERLIDPSKVIRTIEYHHPVYQLGRTAAASRHEELIGPNRSSFCGAYWGNGFHEDGVKSALAVVDRLQGSLAELAHEAVSSR